MLRNLFRSCTVLVLFTAAGVWAADTKTSAVASVTAAQIAERNVAARGGLQTWHAVQALSLTGTLEAGGNNRPTLPMPAPGPARAGKRMVPQIPAQRLPEQVRLPFVMELKRPHKSRLQIEFKGQTAVQVFDGTNGWKLRPFLNRNDIEPYTAEELKDASRQAELDGPLIDYAAKGTKVELEGTEKIEDRDTYQLKLTLKTGQVQHLWIDAKTFLETKIEGTPRRLDGQYHPVAIYFRDYRPVSGLMVAHLLETTVEGVKQTEKLQIEKVTVNPKLDDAHFSKL